MILGRRDRLIAQTVFLWVGRAWDRSNSRLRESPSTRRASLPPNAGAGSFKPGHERPTREDCDLAASSWVVVLGLLATRTQPYQVSQPDDDRPNYARTARMTRPQTLRPDLAPHTSAPSSACVLAFEAYCHRIPYVHHYRWDPGRRSHGTVIRLPGGSGTSESVRWDGPIRSISRLPPNACGPSARSDLSGVQYPAPGSRRVSHLARTAHTGESWRSGGRTFGDTPVCSAIYPIRSSRCRAVRST